MALDTRHELQVFHLFATDTTKTWFAYAVAREERMHIQTARGILHQWLKKGWVEQITDPSTYVRKRVLYRMTPQGLAAGMPVLQDLQFRAVQAS